MNGPRIGELFAGYSGLGMGVQSVIGGSYAWFSEYDPAPSRILAHHYPDVPNLGDITKVDWSQVEPVDVITGGSPCQDLSHAGKRAGMTDGTRSNLWVAMREAIAQLRPRLVIWENVRGSYSAEADSALEQCPRCVGDPRDRGPVLRALGRVLGDLSDLRYDSVWVGLRAADIGAPHGRFRVFVVACDADTVRSGRVGRQVQLDGSSADAAWDRAVAADATDYGRSPSVTSGRQPTFAGAAGNLLPTPAAYDGDRGGPQHPDKRREGGHSVTLQDAVHGLLPTPRATDGTKGGPNQRGTSGDLMLPSAVTLLPTPTSQAAKHGSDDRGPGTLDDFNLWSVVTRTEAWGIYADAIARWEHVLGRPAPAPTQPSKKGTPQLSAAFSEWLMGLPEGHVTAVPGLTRNEQLKALGNGVVPQQAAEAVRRALAALCASGQVSAA